MTTGKVLIVDDIPENLQVLGQILDSAGFEVIYAMEGQQAVESAKFELPDLILMDVNMPGTDGVTATRVIKKEIPEIHVIALTIYEDEEVVEMVKAGVSAYVLKDVAGAELIDTIHRVMQGEVVIHPRVANRLVRELARNDKKNEDTRLTKREKYVLLLLVRGHSNKDMADVMFISEKTVKNHLTSIFKKLGVKDRTQAAVYALKHHIVEDE